MPAEHKHGCVHVASHLIEPSLSPGDRTVRGPAIGTTSGAVAFPCIEGPLRECLQIRTLRITFKPSRSAPRTTMIVCICHRVSDRDIAREVKAGCRDFHELQDELRVATACGACTDCARQTFNGQLHAHGAATPARSFAIVTHRPALAA